MNDVFISYSRKDSDFMERLFETLKAADYESWVDWDDIPKGERWLNEINAGIEGANTFLLIVTAHSLTSEFCNVEIAHALELKKRIVPIIREDIDEKVVAGEWYNKEWEQTARSNWATLKDINWLFFRETDDFDAALKSLLDTLQTDLDYVRNHTRYLERAIEWEQNNKGAAFLLRAEDLQAAQEWLEIGRDERPRPTELQKDYVSASQLAEEHQQLEEDRTQRGVRNLRRASVIAGVVGVAAILATIFALIAFGNAKSQAYAARTNEAIVRTQATYFAAVQNRVSTLAAGGVLIPFAESTQNPSDFVSKLAQIADLHSRSPQIEEDEYGVEQVLVPEGCFWMGSVFQPDEQPVNEICFSSPFWIDRFEVTNEQFDKIGGITANESFWPNPVQPRTDITWFEAQTFCALRDSRLPTEAEWEYAARGPDSLIYPWGNTFIIENVVFDTSETGIIGDDQRASGISWIGAYDMSGNVWEWTSTIYDQQRFPYPYASDEREAYTLETSFSRITRGGGYSDTPLEYPLRAAFRGHQPSLDSNLALGFRCVRSNNDATLTPEIILDTGQIQAVTATHLAMTETLATTIPPTPQGFSITPSNASLIPGSTPSVTLPLTLRIQKTWHTDFTPPCQIGVRVETNYPTLGALYVNNAGFTESAYGSSQFPGNYTVHLGGQVPEYYDHKIWVVAEGIESNVIEVRCDTP